jgi:hypothetical protein
MVKYIHYGAKAFDKNKFEKVSNYFIKPRGGFWASRVNSKYGWKEWNAETEFTTCLKENSFTFSLKAGAKVVELFTAEDLAKLPCLTENQLKFPICNEFYIIDYERCIEMGIDAIELRDIEKGLYYPLYGWDCECILILNPDIVEVSE